MPDITLSKAQCDLLADICDKDQPIAREYRPAQKLVEYGYAEWRERKYSDFLIPTDAGRMANNILKSRLATNGDERPSHE